MARLLFIVLAVTAAFVNAQEPERKKNIAVVGLQAGAGVSEFMINLINEYLGTSVYNSTEYNVISGESIRNLLTHLGKERLLGCTKARCLAGVGDALGVEKVIGGSIDKVPEGYQVNLLLVQPSGGNVLAFLKELYTADESQLVVHLDKYIARLFELEKQTREQQARALEERREFMRRIISESASSDRRISYAAGAARVSARDMEPVTGGDFVKIGYKHGRLRFGFGYFKSDVAFPGDGTVEIDPDNGYTLTTEETGAVTGMGLSCGYEWLSLFSGWVTVTPGLCAGSYSYRYTHTKTRDAATAPVVVFTNGAPEIKSSLGGYAAIDAGHAFGPAAVEGYYTYRLFYLPHLLTVQEFGGRISYIIGK